MRLRPSEAEAHAQVSGLGSFVVGAGVLGHIEARNADGAGGAGDGHERIENCCGRFRCVVSMRLCLEADRVDCSVDLGLADNLGNLIFKRDVPGKVDGLIADSFDMREALGIHVADENNRGVEDLGRGCGSHADRTCAANVDGGSNTDAGIDCSVEASGQDVGEHGEVLYLCHGLGLVRKRDQVEVGVGDHDVLGLAVDPST